MKICIDALLLPLSEATAGFRNPGEIYFVRITRAFLPRPQLESWARVPPSARDGNLTGIPASEFPCFPRAAWLIDISKRSHVQAEVSDLQPVLQAYPELLDSPDEVRGGGWDGA